MLVQGEDHGQTPVGRASEERDTCRCSLSPIDLQGVAHRPTTALYRRGNGGLVSAIAWPCQRTTLLPT